MPPITPWQVYFVYRCRLAKPLPKDKFVVVACLAPDPCGFFINTRVNDYIANNASLMPCQAQILASEHTFLSHDSWIDCRELLSFMNSELIDLRGNLVQSTIDNVQTAVANCTVLRPRLKQMILSIT